VQPSSAEESSPGPVVPTFNRDPVASLQPATTIFTFNGEDFESELVTAADWLAVLMDMDHNLLDLYVRILGDEEGNRFVHSYLTQGGDVEELLVQILEQVSARRWWVGLHLVAAAMGTWPHVGATMLKNGVRPDELSLSAWLDVFTFELVHALKPESVTMLMTKIEMPPDGVAMPIEDMEMSAEDFLSLG
jgi:hypothetical protein